MSVIMKTIKITDMNNISGTVIGARAVLFEMLVQAYKWGLSEHKVTFMSSFVNHLDENNTYFYDDEGVKALIEEAEKQGIKLTCEPGEDAPFNWSMELIHDK